MAKRRVRINLPLISGLGFSLLVLGGGGVWLVKHRGGRNPQIYIQEGDRLFKAGDYEHAIGNWLAASELLPQDAPLHVKIAKAYFKSQRAGSDAIVNSISEFTKAADLDPKSKDAWEGLYTTAELRVSYWETHLTDPRRGPELPAAINTATEAATHLLSLDPGNVAAQAAAPILTIRTWILNLAMPETDADRDLAPDKRKTPEQKVDAAIETLTKLQADHPENEMIPYWIARAKINQATVALHADRPADAPPLFAEAAAQFDTSIAAQPKLIGLYLRKVAILQMLESADTSPTAIQGYRAAHKDTLDQAQQLADPKGDPALYMSAKAQWANLLSQNDIPRGEAIYREVIKQFPDEVGVRLALADLLQRDPSRRSDALAVLNEIPASPPASLTTIIQQENWAVAVANAKIKRADIEVSQLEGMSPGKPRDTLIADIKASLDAGRKIFAGTDQLLRVEGRFELVTGDTVDAVKTLTAASETYLANYGVPDFKLLRLESQAYQAAGMNGKAIELLLKLGADPNVRNTIEYNNLMAQLYLADKDYANAQQYIDWLLARFPNEPSFLSMEISELTATGADSAKIHEVYNHLPEESAGDMRSKLVVAQRIGDRDEQIRLLTKLNAAAPDDKGVSINLAETLANAGRKPEAVKVAEDALKLHPDDPELKVVLSVVGSTGSAEVSEHEEDYISKIKDPFDREMHYVRYYELLQRPDDQLAHLKVAGELRPDDISVQQQLFIQQMNMGLFDNAHAMLPHLASINADSCQGKLLECTLLLHMQDVPNALVLARQLIHDHPEFGPVSEIYGEALMNNGQLELAAQQFGATLALDGTNYDARRYLIQCAVQQGKLDDAKTYIKQARDRYPDDPTYLEMDAQYQIAWGDPELLLPDLDKAVAHQADPQTLRRYYAIDGDTLLAAMRSRAAKGDASGAAGFLSRATDLFKTAVTKWPDDLRFANGLALMYEQNKDFDNAQGVLKTILARPRWKDQPAALNLLAGSYLRSGKVDQAEPLLQQSMSINPQAAQTRLLLEQCKIADKNYEEALEVLHPAVANYTIRQKYIDLLLALNKGAQAEVEMQEAIKAQPSNFDLTNLMLHVYHVEGRYEQGIRAANESLAADPNNVRAYFWRGIFEASGPKPDYDQALKDLGVFHTALPNVVAGATQLAEVYDAKGDRDDAIHQYEAALVLDPQNRIVRLSLLQDYLTAIPARNLDADRLLKQTIALPAFKHDPEFEMKEAMLLSLKDDPDSAIKLAQQAMQDAQDKRALVGDYFSILLNTKHWDLLLQESSAYAADPKAGWAVFNARGMAWAAQNKFTEATADFNTALDRCGIETDSEPARKIIAAICKTMTVPNGKTGVQNALDMVSPRANNSVAWKLLAATLNTANKNIPEATRLAEAALPSIDSLPVDDRRSLLEMTSSLYLNSTPQQTDKAMALYQKMLQANPDDVWALNDVASILTDFSTPPNPQEAIKYSQHAYDLEMAKVKPSARILDTHGWVLVQAGRVEEGIDVLDKAIDQLDIPEVHYHLAIAYLKAKNPYPEEAVRQLTTARDEIAKAPTAQDSTLDPALPSKIEQAMKDADKMVKDKAAGVQ
jgi:tetratricopeptide (TPR) repeat protein